MADLHPDRPTPIPHQPPEAVELTPYETPLHRADVLALTADEHAFTGDEHGRILKWTRTTDGTQAELFLPGNGRPILALAAAGGYVAWIEDSHIFHAPADAPGELVHVATLKHKADALQLSADGRTLWIALVVSFAADAEIPREWTSILSSPIGLVALRPGSRQPSKYPDPLDVDVCAPSWCLELKEGWVRQAVIDDVGFLSTPMTFWGDDSLVLRSHRGLECFSLKGPACEHEQVSGSDGTNASISRIRRAADRSSPSVVRCTVSPLVIPRLATAFVAAACGGSTISEEGGALAPLDRPEEQEVPRRPGGPEGLRPRGERLEPRPPGEVPWITPNVTRDTAVSRARSSTRIRPCAMPTPR